MNLFFLFIVTGLAALWDIRTGKVPNVLLAIGTGIACYFQCRTYGLSGFWEYLLGSILPLVLLAVLFVFHMIGAGDIKLFCVIGGFLGAKHLLSCMAVSFLMGAVISLILLIRRHMFKERLLYFFAYISRFYRTGEKVSYRNSEQAEFCFTIPIFWGVLLCIGGVC